MKNSEAAIVIAAILGAVLIFLCMCGVGAVLISDANSPHWEPIPGTSNYGWQ